MPRNGEKTGVTGAGEQSCSVCSLEPGCIAWDVGREDCGKLERIVEHPPILNEGTHLFRMGDGLSRIYAVRAGVFKSYAFNSDGDAHVLGFSFSGELIGFDGVYSRRHGCNAVAVQDSAVCALPYFDLASLMESSPSLRQQILLLASQGFGDRIVNASLATEARLALFLLDVSKRSGDGDVLTPVAFPIPAFDIASYLRITMQDVENLLVYLVRKNVIALTGAQLRILDPERLKKIAGQKNV